MKKGLRILSLLLVLLIGIYAPETAFGGQAKISFAKEEYQLQNQEAFYIEVSIEEEEAIGDYEMELSYDPQFLTYLDGATSSDDNGSLTLSGTTEDTKRTFYIAFQAIAGGDTQIVVKSGTEENPEAAPAASIFIAPDADVLLQQLKLNGTVLDCLTPDCLTYNIEVEKDTNMLEVQADVTDGEVTVSDPVLSEEKKDVFLTVKNSQGEENIYTLHVSKTLEPQTTAIKNIPESAAQESTKTGISVGKVIGIIVLVLLCLAGCFYMGLMLYDKKRKNKFKKRQQNDEMNMEEKADSEEYLRTYQEVQKRMSAVQEEKEEKIDKADKKDKKKKKEKSPDVKEDTLSSQIAEAMKRAENQQSINEQEPEKTDETEAEKDKETELESEEEQHMIDVSLISKAIEQQEEDTEES